ncbi:hypothetical protein MMC22_008161 [Lobaria immixta]|nr:hypothetical protein [Lobaria immixta]
MGAAVSVAKDAIKDMDGAKQKEGEIKEALDNMQQMAQDQLDFFYERIGNANYDAKLIPINKVLSHYQYVRCSSENHDAIGPGIQDAVKDFSSGPMAQGLANLGANVIKTLLGASKGIRQMETKYAISIDPLGGISRLDTVFFVYNFESEGLIKTANSVVASCVVKSSADTKAIDDNTLRVLVNECFETSSMDLRKAIYGEIREVLFNSDDSEYQRSLREARAKNTEVLLEWAKPKALVDVAHNTQALVPATH